MFFLCGLDDGLQQRDDDPQEEYRVAGIFDDLLCLGRGAISDHTCGDDIRCMVLREEDRMVPG